MRYLQLAQANARLLESQSNGIKISECKPYNVGSSCGQLSPRQSPHEKTKQISSPRSRGRKPAVDTKAVSHFDFIPAQNTTDQSKEKNGRMISEEGSSSIQAVSNINNVSPQRNGSLVSASTSADLSRSPPHHTDINSYLTTTVFAKSDFDYLGL